MSLADLKAGDQVVVDRRIGYHLAIVQHATKLHLVVGNTKYRRAGGRALNVGAWDSNSIREVTPDLLKRIEEQDSKARADRSCHALATAVDKARRDGKAVDHVEAIEALTRKLMS